jgi:ribosomal protein L37AE/L43A
LATAPEIPGHELFTPASGFDVSTPLVETIIINTIGNKADGLNKCPRCGSTEISLQPEAGLLQCNYCRFVFEPLPPDGFYPAEALRNEVRGSGAGDIDLSAPTQITLKCQGCGAKVVVDVDETTLARCHWCRQTLSAENQIPNGAVPDIVLPFKLSREQARQHIEDFVKKRTFFTNRTFKREFSTENILGVYLPYLVVDANAHSNLKGRGGRVMRTYRAGNKNNRRTYYDIAIYRIERDFDLFVHGLTIEASSEKRNMDPTGNTNNIINAIMPFDVENAVAYTGNYLKGFASERRDTNLDQLRHLADAQIHDIARFQANQTAANYDAGIRWQSEKTVSRGAQWRSAYLPVWLYSYQQVKKNGRKILHYVAVNARTGETMGSVPVDIKRLFMASVLLELIAAPIGLAIMFFVS